MTGNKLISIVTSCYNEAGNIEELYARIKAVMEKFPAYAWELIIADNFSTDGTRDIIRMMAQKDKRVKAIFNARNFGHIRSPMNALKQAEGDAVISMCSDLQDPPELIEQMLQEWENGTKVVIGVRDKTECSIFMELFRKFYYSLLKKAAPEENLISGFTGYGLYDKQFMDAFRSFDDPYPYFRGIVSEIGLKRLEIPFTQPKRKHGKTKNNFFTLYDMAMTGFVNHTKLPLRLAVFSGFFIAFLSLLVALGYLVYKLCNWDNFQVGMAPLVIGLFFFSAVQLIFIGILGEYIGAIYTQVKNRPLVIEEERINFDE
ncbi:MAG: glycosyltransferase family 2 protein [Lentisphaerae bacterium]|nr:glycosyltransferase family 2 protein [Lentisphaerota bacterium]